VPTFVELTLVNWHRPWGSRRLDFVIRAGSFNFFCRQDQQILRLPTAAAARSLQQNSSSTSTIIYIIKIFTASSSKIVKFVQINGSLDEFLTSRKSNLIQAETRWKVFIEKQHTQQVSTSLPSRIAMGLGIYINTASLRGGKSISVMQYDAPWRQDPCACMESKI
jgi:hypothetical protein